MTFYPKHRFVLVYPHDFNNLSKYNLSLKLPLKTTNFVFESSLYDNWFQRRVKHYISDKYRTLSQSYFRY